jgi:exopolyphosphatase
MNFREFLSNLPNVFKSSHPPHRFVLGNSSADYDSIFGSLIYAYLLSVHFNQSYIPLIDCKRHEIPLRFDVSYIMKKYNINYMDLIYTEDVKNLYGGHE